jgi:Dyp-type peroxidase family
MNEQLPIDLDEELSPIDPEDPKYERMLANLQGNILKSHGRNHAVHLFLTFPDAQDTDKINKVREWIAGFAARYLTSALRQHYETKEFKINRISGRIFGGFYLSAEGYRALGFGAEQIDKFNEKNLEDEIDPDDASTPSNIDISFKNGMAAGEMELRDVSRDEWEDSFRNPLHALVLLADDEEDRLRDVAWLVSRKLEDLEISFFRQDGDVLRNKETQEPIEHFGFRDGISQPFFYQADVQEARKSGYRNWDSFAPLKLVLIEDPLVDQKDCFGSYLVYRKLEQNVKGFQDEKDKLTAQLTGKEIQDLTNAEKEQAGALVVGRFRNGIPLMLTNDTEKVKLTDFNNFNYVDKDTGSYTGNKCPYHAHIRRMNPRGESAHIEKEVMRRIVRRGITYGNRTDNNAEPTGNVGLLFMCFQSSVPAQFGFIQTKWANTSAFLGRDLSGLDPIIGRNESIEPETEERRQKWCPVWGSSDAPHSFEFKSFVTLKGGEFFFAPSIAFLRSLTKKTENQA